VSLVNLKLKRIQEVALQKLAEAGPNTQWFGCLAGYVCEYQCGWLFYHR
jgi:aminopeptidase C